VHLRKTTIPAQTEFRISLRDIRLVVNVMHLREQANLSEKGFDMTNSTLVPLKSCAGAAGLAAAGDAVPVDRLHHDGRYGVQQLLDENPRWRSTACCTCRDRPHGGACRAAVYLASSDGAGSNIAERRSVTSNIEHRTPNTRTGAPADFAPRAIRFGAAALGLRARDRCMIFSPGGELRGAGGHLQRRRASGELWELWQKRGWVKEGRHYLKLAATSSAGLPEQLHLEPATAAIAATRSTARRALHTGLWQSARSTLTRLRRNHWFSFSAGTQTVFSLATSGCGIRCLNCQNWRFRRRNRRKPRTRAARVALAPAIASEPFARTKSRLRLFPEDVVAVTESLGCPSISYTTPSRRRLRNTTQDTAKPRERSSKHRRSCGSIEDRAGATCISWTPRTVDLEGFRRDIYQKLTPASSSPF